MIVNSAMHQQLIHAFTSGDSRLATPAKKKIIPTCKNQICPSMNTKKCAKKEEYCELHPPGIELTRMN